MVCFDPPAPTVKGRSCSRSAAGLFPDSVSGTESVLHYRRGKRFASAPLVALLEKLWPIAEKASASEFQLGEGAAPSQWGRLFSQGARESCERCGTTEELGHFCKESGREKEAATRPD